jgi:hypothetical protein
MRENHIIHYWKSDLSSLSTSELDLVKAHIAGTQLSACPMKLPKLRYCCCRSFSHRPPLFQTRYAAIRAQTWLRTGSISSRWQTARPLIASMGALIMMLLALTFLTDSSQLQTQPSNLASISDDSPELVFVDRDGQTTKSPQPGTSNHLRSGTGCRRRLWKTALTAN